MFGLVTPISVLPHLQARTMELLSRRTVRDSASMDRVPFPDLHNRDRDAFLALYQAQQEQFDATGHCRGFPYLLPV